MSMIMETMAHVSLVTGFLASGVGALHGGSIEAAGCIFVGVAMAGLCVCIKWMFCQSH